MFEIRAGIGAVGMVSLAVFLIGACAGGGSIVYDVVIRNGRVE